LTTSAPARERIPFILRDMRKRYLPARDLRQGATALARISARTEDPYKVLISTILSQRTRDEMTEVASAQLFAKYETPRAMASAPVDELERLIRPVGFYRQKAIQLRKVSQVLLDRHGGRVPRTYEELRSLPQVGPKTANCVLVYGYGEPRIPVDTHVHRVSNRLGIVRTKTPEATEPVLMRVVPKDAWLEVNELFIRFGKEVCRPIGPRCGACSFTSFCRHYRTVVSKADRRRAARPRPSRR
jgi:endonuclease-3